MSVQQKGDSYFPVLYVRDSKTGKSKHQWFDAYPTKKAAERAERRLRADQDRGKSIERTRETVAEFLHRWLAFKRTDGTRPKTLDGYEDIVEKRWIPAIGHVRMTDLRAEHILDAQTDWFTNGIWVHNRGCNHAQGRCRQRLAIPRKQTILNYRRCLHTALEDYRRWRNGEWANPSEIAQGMPNVDDAEEVLTLTAEESRALIAIAATPEFACDIRTQLVLFGLFMGMRPGELGGIRRQDVNRTSAFVVIRQTVAQLRKKGVVIQENQTKNRASKAPVELTEGALAALTRAAAIQSEQIKDAGSAWVDNNLVFTNALGGPLNPQWLRAHFRKMLKAAGLTSIKLHGLRHTHATILLADGAHPKLVQERLRHSRISVTMDTYSHVIPTLRSGTAARVDRLFGTQESSDSLENSLETDATMTQ
jgi:integrase